jgi:predicted nucleic acid-binding protein
MSGSTACLDAGVVLQLLLNNEDQKVLAQWKLWTQESTTLVAPTLMAYEVVGVFRKLASEGKLKEDEAADLLGLFLKLGITFHGDGELHAEALELGADLGLATGDVAHYLALARRFEAQFWTASSKLAEELGPKVPYLKLL